MILNTLGDIGGIFELVFIILAILYFFYKGYARNRYLRKIMHKKSEAEYKKILGEEFSKKLDNKLK